MKDLLVLLLLLFTVNAHSADQRTDCINAIVSGAQENAPRGRTYNYLEEHKILVENINGTQWLYVDHGSSFTDAQGEYYSCVSNDRDPERELNVRVLSILNETLANSPNPEAYLNTLLVPCRRSGVRAFANRVNQLSNSGYSGAGSGTGGAIDGDGN